ncbi:MAG: Uma2 family endonuclease [Planctomycetota bacterium]
MATVSVPLMTADEFFDFAHRPDNEGKFLELERGEVVVMPPAGKYHGFVCLNVGSILREFGKKRKKGYACSNDAGVIVERNPDTVRGPDISFFEDDQQPKTMERQYSTTTPKLVVEILSPHDQPGKLLRRIKQYLSRGIELVWVVDPENRFVSVYRPGREYQIISESEEITGEDVLPDLRCAVAEFFDG